MNVLKGTFYILFLSYKKQNLTFWIILTTIVAVSFILNSIFNNYVYFFLTISIPVYIFYSIVASKFLYKTMPYFLKLGMNRMQYILIIGLFFVLWSIFGAFLIGCFHEGILLVSNQLETQNIQLIHPILLFTTNPSFWQTFVLDIVLLLNGLMLGLLLNTIFYRLGTVGGYSFIGTLVLVPIVVTIFDWYESLLNTFHQITFMVAVVSFIVIGVMLYVIIIGGLRKVSTNPA